MKKWLLFSLMLILLVSCGKKKSFMVEGDKKIFDKAPGLYETFVRYWSYRSALDVSGAFSLEAPYFQFVVPEKAYSSFVKWFGKSELRGITPYKVECDQQFFCCVDMKMDFVLKKSGKHDIREGHDCWIKVKDKWYHVMRNPLLFPGGV